MNPWLVVGLTGAGLLWWHWRKSLPKTEDNPTGDPQQGIDTAAADPIVSPVLTEAVDQVDAANAANLAATEAAPAQVENAALAAPVPVTPAAPSMSEAKASPILRTPADQAEALGVNQGADLEPPPPAPPDLGLRAILTGTVDLGGSGLLATVPGPQALASDRVLASVPLADTSEEAAPLVETPEAGSVSELPADLGAAFTVPAGMA